MHIQLVSHFLQALEHQVKCSQPHKVLLTNIHTLVSFIPFIFAITHIYWWKNSRFCQKLANWKSFCIPLYLTCNLNYYCNLNTNRQKIPSYSQSSRIQCDPKVWHYYNNGRILLTLSFNTWNLSNYRVKYVNVS